MSPRDYKTKIEVPPKAMLMNIESIALESQEFDDSKKITEEVCSRYRLCLHSWINYMDGEESKRTEVEKRTAENNSARHLALAGLQYHLLEGTSKVFSKYYDLFFNDIPRGECLLSEEMYQMELKKLRRNVDIRREDKLYINSYLDGNLCRKKK